MNIFHVTTFLSFWVGLRTIYVYISMHLFKLPVVSATGCESMPINKAQVRAQVLEVLLGWRFPFHSNTVVLALGATRMGIGSKFAMHTAVVLGPLPFLLREHVGEAMLGSQGLDLKRFQFGVYSASSRQRRQQVLEVPSMSLFRDARDLARRRELSA